MHSREIYKKYIAVLKNIYGGAEASAITDIIFRKFIGLSKTEMVSKENEFIIRDETAEMLNAALQKLSAHCPVQYITGEAWFYHLLFFVNEHVLIPRPETEELAEEAINYIKENDCKKILDIGTGSGCIPISIKKNIPDAVVTALDKSAEALKVAKANAAAHQAEISFIEMDFLNDMYTEQLSQYDVIISNPPYIPEDEKKLLQKNVTLYEPHTALFVPQSDPLVFYRQIAVFAQDHLSKEGKIFLEVHQDFAKETAAIFTENNYDVVIKKDISGNERMVFTTKKI